MSEDREQGIPYQPTRVPSNGTTWPRSDAGTLRPGTADDVLYPNLDLPADTVIEDQFRVVDELTHTGGEADVFKCVDINNQDTVVLKIYRQNIEPKQQVLEKLVGIVHEDIISLRGFGRWNDRFYEVMEFAEGGSLDRYAPFTEQPITGNILPQILNALKFMHDRGIFHRDLKPSNLLYRDAECEDVVVGDFGVASVVDGQASVHLSRAWAGTNAFSAPEAYAGRVGKEVDYYSLGMILMYLVEGKSPFEGMTEQEIMYIHISKEIFPPRGCSERFKTLISGLLVKSEEHRWGYDEVRRWLNGEDVPVVSFQQAAVSPAFHYKLDEGLEAGDIAGLGTLLLDNPELGMKHLKQGILIDVIKQYDPSLASKLYDIRENAKNMDEAYYEIMYTLNPKMPYRLLGG